MIPDPHEQTVRIPVKWSNGRWQLLENEGALPEFKDGSIADLVLLASYLMHPEDVESWTREVQHLLLPASTPVLVRVNRQNVPIELMAKLVNRLPPNKRGQGFVEVTLKQDLILTVVSGKKGRLLDCKCLIPALNETADSLNEAYKKIAIAFEPTRRSNAGNIFQLAFIERNGKLESLDKRRDEVSTADVSSESPPDSSSPQSTAPQAPGMS